MSDTSHEPDENVFPTSDAKDVLRALVADAISPIPYANPIFTRIIRSKLEKRQEKFFRRFFEDFQRLEKNFEDFKVSLEQNETFTSTYVEIVRSVIATHDQEKLDALRNALLNSALPDAPDDIQQKIFVQWINDLTSWHLKILSGFETERIPFVDLDQPQWEKNSAFSELADVFDAKFPQLADQHDLFVQIIRDLRNKGLIANLTPERHMLTRINTGPKLTPLSKGFLKFIKSPLPPPTNGSSDK